MAQDTPRRQAPTINPVDPIWHRVRQEASDAVKADPAIATFIYAGVLNQPSLEQAIAHRIAERLDHPDVPADLIRQAYDAMFQDDTGFSEAVRIDLQAVFERDPACKRFIEPLMYFKGSTPSRRTDWRIGH